MALSWKWCNRLITVTKRAYSLISLLIVGSKLGLSMIWVHYGTEQYFVIHILTGTSLDLLLSPSSFHLNPYFLLKRGRWDWRRKIGWKLMYRAITPAKENVTYTISYNPKTAHIRIFIDEVMIREVHGFPTPSSSSSASTSSDKKEEEKKKEGKEGQVFIGIMGCSPLGQGTDATFQQLEMREGVRDLV